MQSTNYDRIKKLRHGYVVQRRIQGQGANPNDSNFVMTDFLKQFTNFVLPEHQNLGIKIPQTTRGFAHGPTSADFQTPCPPTLAHSEYHL